MKIGIAVNAALLVAAVAGLVAQLPASDSSEVSALIAQQLIGGADCEKTKNTSCPKDPTKACPLTLGWLTGTGPVKTKPSGSVWCGCVTNCANTKMIKGTITCGS